MNLLFNQDTSKIVTLRLEVFTESFQKNKLLYKIPAGILVLNLL
jgi:hypothetical protein